MKKILLLEDEHTIGSLYIEALQWAWYNPIWTKNTNKFNKIIKEKDFDVIFLDNYINWKKTSLKRLLVKLKKVFPKTYIIMISNDPNSDIRQMALSNWAYDYLLKIDTYPDDLVQYVNNLI